MTATADLYALLFSDTAHTGSAGVSNGVISPVCGHPLWDERVWRKQAFGFLLLCFWKVSKIFEHYHLTTNDKVVIIHVTKM